MNENSHNLPYELEDMPDDAAFGKLTSFSKLEVMILFLREMISI